MEDPNYPGSRFLTPITESLGIPIDQVNFVACELLALVLGYPFRVYLSPKITSPKVRHIWEAAIGIAMILFVYGHHAFMLLAQSLSCYLLILLLPNRVMPKVVSVAAILQLCVCHIWRQTYQYKNAGLDISAPFMMNTQRVTSLAWSLYDGRIKDSDKLTTNQRRLAISKIPSLLEIMSYTFCFHGVIVGPFFFYKDYINFIDGTNLQNKVAANGSNNNHKVVYDSKCPSPTLRVLKNTFLFVLNAAFVLVLIPAFPYSYLSDPSFLSSGFFSMMRYLLIITGTFRFKYFAAWKLGEAVNNNAGLGFYYDNNGEAKWDLVDSANLLEIESATSMKMLLDNWNMTTYYWLRYIVYDRVSSLKTMKVFMLSTIWHGFYPGYFLTAATAAIFVVASRLIRRNLRPLFVSSKEGHLVYDVITFLTTRVAIAYSCFPFIHLEFSLSLEIYKKLFFWLHILAIAVIVVFSLRVKKDKMSKKVN